MTELKHIQQTFCNYLRDTPTKSSKPPFNLNDEKMAIYQEVVFNNIASFIDKTYPIAQCVLSKSQWLLMIKLFIKAHKLESPLFFEIANEFRLFLKNTSNKALSFLNKHVYIHDLLHFEYLENLVYANAARPIKKNQKSKHKHIDLKTLNLEALGQINLSFRTKLWLASYEYPVYQLLIQYHSIHIVSNNLDSLNSSVNFVNFAKQLKYEPSSLFAFYSLKTGFCWQVLPPVQAYLLELLLNQNNLASSIELSMQVLQTMHACDETIAQKIVMDACVDLLNILHKYQLINTQ